LYGGIDFAGCIHAAAIRENALLNALRRLYRKIADVVERLRFGKKTKGKKDHPDIYPMW
jgi:hypothetical protein